MDTIAKSDIFFFITSLSIVVISILLASLLVYSFRIVKDLRSLATKIKEEGEEILKDVKHTRLQMAEKRNNLLDFIGNLFKKKARKKSHSTEPKE